jgi:hypothetical protein
MAKAAFIVSTAGGSPNPIAQFEFTCKRPPSAAFAPDRVRGGHLQLAGAARRVQLEGEQVGLRGDDHRHYRRGGRRRRFKTVAE